MKPIANAHETAPTSPRLSIIIPVYNAQDTLAEQLEAVLDQLDDEMELLIVDNRSTDQSRQIAEAFAERDRRIRVANASERPGEPHARNVGVQEAHSDHFAFCDADDVIGAGWATAMRDALEEFDFVTGPVDVDKLNPRWLAGFRGRSLFDKLPRTAGGVAFAHGCNFGVRRSAAASIGGFDETVMIGCDVDFALRLHRAGVALHWVPGAVVHYRHRGSTKERMRQAYAFGRAQYHHQTLVGEPNDLVHRLRRQTRRIGWLVTSSPKLSSRAHRAAWTWTLSVVLGEIRGGSR